MRIAYLCFDDGIRIGASKGAAVHVVNIANAFASIGNEVMVLATAGQTDDDNHHFDLQTLQVTPFARRLLHLIDRINRNKRIANDLRILIKLFAYRSSAKRLIKQWQPDFLMERYSLFCLNGIHIAKKLAVPIGLEINAPAALEAKKWRNLALTRLASRIELRAFRSADVCFTVSRQLNQYVSNLVGSSESIVTLSNGVDLHRFNPSNPSVLIKKQLNIPGDAIVIGYVGGFKEWHDVKSLILAFQRLDIDSKQLYLLLVGNGQTYQQCEELVRNQNLNERVIFTGQVSPNQVPDYIAAMDITTAPFIPLKFFYFSPLKLFEYMAAGKCIVTSQIGQIDEIVTHHENGWLYTPGEVNELAEALEILIDSSEMRIQFGLQAREWVETRHTWNKNAEIITSYLGN